MRLSNRNLNLKYDSGVSGPHPDHLDLLEEFSFGPNGRSNDDFRLLELTEIGSADVPHAGRNCSDQILTAVVNVIRDRTRSVARGRLFQL